MTCHKYSLLVALFAAVGCSESVPENPTWFGDVQPILSANCARCHGPDPYDPSIAGFRLDRYVQNDDLSFDAYDFRDSIVAQAVDLQAPAMPLDYTLSDRQRTILERWVANGAPKGERQNTAPSAVAIAPADMSLTVDQSLDLVFRAWDADGDGLRVAVLAREVGTDGGDILVSSLGQGMRTLSLDAGTLASKRSFEIVAVVDDGFSDNPADNETEVVLLSDVFVDHGERGTAPRVLLLSPNDGGTIIGSTTISWSATDPDEGDVLTIDLDLIRIQPDGTETVDQSIASGLSNDVQSFVWDVSAVAAADSNGDPIEYKVRVTATDAGAKNTRSDDSDLAFTIAAGGGETNLTWADVKPIFIAYCIECHGQPARQPSLEDFRLDKYDAADPEPPMNSDPGVFEMRSDVFSRLVVNGNMPPASKPQPSAADIAQIEEWILAGAPLGGGPVDGLPTFTWTTPNNAAVSKTTTGDITLGWTAGDPEALPITGSISVVEISAPSDALANCDATLTGWTAIADADVTAGTYPYTAPNTGYFCFRGEVTDDAGQTTTSIAAKPVKYSTMGPPGP